MSVGKQASSNRTQVGVGHPSDFLSPHTEDGAGSRERVPSQVDPNFLSAPSVFLQGV